MMKAMRSRRMASLQRTIQMIILTIFQQTLQLMIASTGNLTDSESRLRMLMQKNKRSY